MPTSFYRKTCKAEDLFVEIKPKVAKLELALQHVLTVAIDNQGDTDTPYDEIAADHLVHQLSKMNDILDYKY